MNTEDVNISVCLLDVLRGYSKIVANNKTYYFRHFRIYDDLELSEFESEAFLAALKRGIKSKSELLEIAISKGFWTKQEEESVKSLEWVIDKSETALSKVSDYMARKAMENSINEDKKKLKDLLDKKNSIIAHCAENLASKKKYTKTLEDNLFEDEEMTKNINREDLFYLIPKMGEKIEQIGSRDNMLKMAYDASFFDIYSNMYRNPFDIFKTDIYSISLWQKNLISYASVLLNKLKNYDMPTEIKSDPLKVYKFNPKTEESKDKSVVHGVDDLRQKMAKKGGKLEASDF